MLLTLERIRARFSKSLVFKVRVGSRGRVFAKSCQVPKLSRREDRPLRLPDDAPRRPRVGRDAVLYRVAEEMALSPEQLAELKAKLPPSTHHYDDEEEMAY